LQKVEVSDTCVATDFRFCLLFYSFCHLKWYFHTAVTSGVGSNLYVKGPIFRQNILGCAPILYDRPPHKSLQRWLR